MAKKPQSKSTVKPAVRTVQKLTQKQATPAVVVSGRWMAAALGIVLALAAMCVYATLCLLFYQGQWQLVLRSSRTVTATPASKGLKFDEIRFDYTET